MSINKEFGHEIITQLEAISGQLSEAEISERIKNFIEKIKKSPPEVLLWEQMAFAFIENYPDDKAGWGTYFGPMFTLTDKEGKMIEYPSMHEITHEVISYWENRAKESRHPIFKARYSNLVWDFKTKITKEKPCYLFVQIFVDSVVEIAEKNLHKSSTNVIEKLERALSLALSINDEERVSKLIDTIINYEQKIAEDDKAGLWGFSYELLVKNNKKILNEDKEQKVIRDLEERYERLLKGSNHWAAKRAAVLLIDYYSKKGDFEKTKTLLQKLGSMIQKQADQVSPFQASAWLEELCHLYLQYGLKDEVNKILIKIKELGKKSLSELKRIETSVAVPKKDLEEFIGLPPVNWTPT